LAGLRRIELVLDTGTALSGISESLKVELDAAGLLVSSGRSFRGNTFFLLSGLSVDGQALPDMEVLESDTASHHRIDGMLGLDFLVKFRRITFDVEQMRMTLTLR
jgi:hypothetical protein